MDLVLYWIHQLTNGVREMITGTIKVTKSVFDKIVAVDHWMDHMPDHLSPTRVLGSAFYENIAAEFRSYLPIEEAGDDDWFACFDVYSTTSTVSGYQIFAKYVNGEDIDTRCYEVLIGE